MLFNHELIIILLIAGNGSNQIKTICWVSELQPGTQSQNPSIWTCVWQRKMTAIKVCMPNNKDISDQQYKYDTMFVFLSGFLFC